MPGSDNGLAKAPCITAPAVARHAPTRTPRTMRGRRITHTNSSATGSDATSEPMPMRRSTAPNTSPTDTR